MFRYKLRTLLIALAIGPPLAAGFWFYPWLLAIPLSVLAVAAGFAIAVALSTFVFGLILGEHTR